MEKTRGEDAAQAGGRVLLIAGAGHTGKTVLANKLTKRCGVPFYSIDHLKMGLIRSGICPLTPESPDGELTEYLWPIVRETIKTALENGQSLIVEGCYFPRDWQAGLEGYRGNIRALCLVLSEEYIRENAEVIYLHGSDAERRGEEAPDVEQLVADNRAMAGHDAAHGWRQAVVCKSYGELDATPEADWLCGRR